MYWLKGCPRCRGDLHEEEDAYGRFLECIQCAYVPTEEEERQLRAVGEIERRPVSPVGQAA